MKRPYILSLALILCIAGSVSRFPVFAEDYTSSNFILRDPVITTEGGESTSATFHYFSSTGETITGEATGTDYIYRAGFQFYPVASSPVLSATAGDTEVSLTWTASAGTLANITDYEIGITTVSGGPYTYASVGNILAYTKTGLTNGTTYYFKLKANAGTLMLAQSAEVSAAPAGSSSNNNSGGGSSGGGSSGGGASSGGGSGSSGNTSTETSVIFSGRAYPRSTVTLLKDAQIAASTIAGTDAMFEVKLTGLSGGTFIFSLYGEDNQGRRSTLLSFPISVTVGAATNVSGIFIAPTLAVDKSQVKKGEDIAIFGQSSPGSEITIQVNSDQEFFNKVTTDASGVYLYNFDTTPLSKGAHTTKTKTAYKGEVSSFSSAIGFIVGDKTVMAKAADTSRKKGDMNADKRVNLVDFSILAFWYKKPLSANFTATEKAFLNGDGKVDLLDFSIMAYYWTG